jgi:hypothetical protein
MPKRTSQPARRIVLLRDYIIGRGFWQEEAWHYKCRVQCGRSPNTRVTTPFGLLTCAPGYAIIRHVIPGVTDLRAYRHGGDPREQPI